LVTHFYSSSGWRAGSSVTQQFNTTTSMGRLTLNVLLSFAQFEREVTSERIRDKIAASKRKGLWGGPPPPWL
jgi:site-specific DNA recombinase